MKTMTSSVLHFCIYVLLSFSQGVDQESNNAAGWNEGQEKGPHFPCASPSFLGAPQANSSFRRPLHTPPRHPHAAPTRPLEV